MHSRNSILYTLLSLIVLLSLLVACEGKDEEELPVEQIVESEQTIGKVAITFACPAWAEGFYRNLADQFEASNPDVRVQLVPREGGIANLNGIAAQADTLIMPVFFPALSRGMVRDLTPFIAADTTFQPEDFYTHTLESLQWDGGTWGVPFAVHFHLIFYDKAAFDTAGVPYPEPGWTWDDFLAAAEALTEREGGKIVRWGFEWRLRDPLPFIQGRAGALVDTSGEWPVPLLDRPAVAEAARWFTDLALMYRVMNYPEQVEMPDSESPRPTEDTRAAMWNGTSTSWQGANTDVGIAPFPVGEQLSTATSIDLETYVMSAGTTHPQESWRWLAFLSRQLAGAGMPARRSLANGYWAGLDESTAATYHFAQAHGYSPINSLWVEQALREALDAILRKELGVEEALTQAQTAASTDIASELNETAASAKFVVPAPTPVSAEGTPIVFIATQSYWGRKGIYEALAEQFHELHPEITVEVKPPLLPTGASQVTLQQIAAQGDCLETFPPFLWSDTSALMDLNPLINADSTLPLDDFYPSFIDSFYHEGKLWALPSEGYPRVLCYNKDLFGAAGLAYPTADWALDDFITLAAALSQGEGADRQYGYASSFDPLAEPVFFVEQYGARLLDNNVGVDVVTLDTSAMAEAVRWYATMISAYRVSPTTEGDDLSVDALRAAAEQWQYLVRENRAAMWSIYPVGTNYSLWGGSSYSQDQKVGVAPMPQGPGRVSDFTLLGYSISAHTEHLQLCWEWMKFLSAQPQVFGGMPARRSVAESEAYRQQVEPELLEIYLSTLEQSDRILTSAALLGTERTGFILTQFQAALKAALDGENVEQALNIAQQKVDKYLLCLETTTGYKDQAELINTCVTQAETMGQ